MYYSVGSSGDPVKEIQAALNRAAESLDIPACPLEIDGKFGKKTKEAVMQFQLAKGYATRDIDGIVGPMTLADLLEDEPVSVMEAAERCLAALEALPEYKALEALLYG